MGLVAGFRALGRKWAGASAGGVSGWGGINSGGSSGPSAAAAAASAYVRRKSGAPLLDSIFGVDQVNG